MFHSPLEIGFYALATRVISMPMMLIGDSVSKVFLQQATLSAGKGVGLAKETKNLFGNMVYISLPVVVVLIWFGGNLFELIFGPEWLEAGVYAQILSISFLGMFLYRPLSALFDALERPRARLIFNVTFLIGRVGAVVLAAYVGSTIITTIIVLTATTCLLYAGAFVYLFGLIGVSIGEILSIIVKKGAILAPIFIGIPFLKFLGHDYSVVSTFVAAGLVMLQGGFILFLDPGLTRQLQQLIPSCANKQTVRKQPY
jgi:O-antigen/teichoic acid export membrane protein